MFDQMLSPGDLAARRQRKKRQRLYAVLVVIGAFLFAVALSLILGAQDSGLLWPAFLVTSCIGLSMVYD